MQPRSSIEVVIVVTRLSLADTSRAMHDACNKLTVGTSSPEAQKD